MARLRRLALCDVIEDLPNPVSLGDRQFLQKDALFVCALGFEERCLTVPRTLARRGYRTQRAIYLRYATNQADNDANRPELLSRLQEVADEVDSLEVDSDEYTQQMRSVIESLDGGDGEAPCVTFDISVAANRVILRVLRILLDSNVYLRFIYTEAAIYRPTKEEYEAEPQKWIDNLDGLERGVEVVGVSSDHVGQHLDSLPDCVMLFPSFNVDRSEAVLSFVDPALIISPGERVVWLLGIPHLTENLWRLEAMRDINKLRGESVPQYEISTFKYKETLERLHAICEERWRSHRFSLSPLGSKMQAVGAALASFMHPEIRVILAVPREYNASRYSHGAKEIWELEFGDMAKVCRTLGSVGTLMIDEDGRR